MDVFVYCQVLGCMRWANYCRIVSNKPRKIVYNFLHLLSPKDHVFLAYISKPEFPIGPW